MLSRYKLSTDNTILVFLILMHPHWIAILSGVYSAMSFHRPGPGNINC